jgi:hypothetical protein
MVEGYTAGVTLDVSESQNKSAVGDRFEHGKTQLPFKNQNFSTRC